VEDGYYSGVTWLDAPKGVRFSTELTIYEESLTDGRLIGHSWTNVGRQRLRDTFSAASEATCPVPAHAFELEIDGQSLHYGWEWVGADEEDDNGIRHVTVELQHTVRPVTVRLHTLLDGTPCLTRWLEVTNASDHPAALASVAPWSGMLWRIAGWNRQNYRDLVAPWSGQPFSLGYYADDNALEEGDFVWEPLKRGTTQLESRHGRSGWGIPFFVLRQEGSGEHFIGHLGWSGNWMIQFDYAESKNASDAALSFRAGPLAPAPLRMLEPAETIATPRVHLGYMVGDLDQCVQAMHSHLRRSVLPASPEGRGQRVIGKGTGYMGLGREMSEARLKESIDLAAEVGCELYLIDAGWYRDSAQSWHDTVGDWYAGDHLAHGLEPVFAYARSKGLLYGLWVEIERISSGSQAMKDHPDWVLSRYGKPIERAPLDLTNPEAAAWVESEIIRIIETYDLDLFRLDYNINIWEGGQNERHGFLENTQWRHYEALYAIFGRIRKRFPSLILENCASGGGRMDVGIMSQFHTTWISDWMALPRSGKIINGVTMALPPEVCNRMTGASMHADVYGDLDSQLRTTLFGHMTLNDTGRSMADLNPVMLARAKHYVELYKTFVRPMLTRCRVFHHTPVIGDSSPRGWCVLEYAAEDALAAMAGFFRLAGPAEESYHFCARGLDPSREYEVTFDNQGKTVKATGLELMHRGLTIRVGNPINSELLLFRAV
jgi:alpha-galactosidase